MIANCRVLLAALSLCLLNGACGAVAPESGDEITLVNVSGDTIGYVAIERDISVLALFAERIPASDLGERIIAPSASALLPVREIERYYPGAAVRILVYRVADGEAVIREMLTFTHAELVAMRWHVEIRGASVPP